MAKVIEVNNVYKSFGKGESITNVLSGASLSVENGEFVSLMGASGSGKSTLLYLIGGLDRNFEGNISICGSDIGKMKEKALSALRLEKIGFIFQFYNLVQNLNVEDNILLPSSVKGKSKAEMKAKLDEILKITGLTEKRKAKPAQLSGGQQQRVSIGRALMNNPALLLADEPTGNLDSENSREIISLLRKFNRENNQTVIIITHDERIALSADRVITIEDGRITKDSKTAEVSAV